MKDLATLMLSFIFFVLHFQVPVAGDLRLGPRLLDLDGRLSSLELHVPLARHSQDDFPERETLALHKAVLVSGHGCCLLCM
jgi:hypothetical protein